jgi:hypothetical protein
MAAVGRDVKSIKRKKLAPDSDIETTTSPEWKQQILGPNGHAKDATYGLSLKRAEEQMQANLIDSERPN